MNKFYYYCLLLFFYVTVVYDRFKEMLNKLYVEIESFVLDNTFTEIYFYDFYALQKKTLRSNSNVFMLGFLFLRKRLLGLDNKAYTDLTEFFTPLMNLQNMGLFEIVWYSETKTTTYVTKGEHLHKNDVLKYMCMQDTPQYLHVSLCNHNITHVFNQLVTSFHPSNQIQVHDLCIMMYIMGLCNENINETNSCLELICNDTLDEIKFWGDDKIVCIQDVPST